MYLVCALRHASCRRQFLATLGLLLCAALAGPAAAEVTLHDITGREIVLPAPAQRILIDDGRYLIALSLIDKDPVSRLAGWPHDANRLGRATYAAYKAKFPGLDDLPRVASSAAEISVEQVLAARPDLAIFSLGSQPTEAQRSQIESAGIPVVVIDFFIHPLENLEPSLRLLGQAVGREKEAEAFLAFRRARLDAVAARVATLPPGDRPRVFLEPHAGMTADCCNSPGQGNVGDMIAFAGGTNIGSAVIPRASGKLNLEYVIAEDPEVYIATGGSHMEGTGGLLIGPEYDAARARETLGGLMKRPGFSGFAAAGTGQVYGFAHQLLNSPLDIVTVEILAKWIHPALFADLDVGETVRTLNSEFLAIPLEGINWIGLD